MLKTQITGAKYLSPQTNQMTNLNIAVPADSKDTEFGTSDILLAKDVVAYLNTLDSDISKELATQTDKITKINEDIKQLVDHNLIKIVTELPTTNIDNNCIYLVANNDGEGNNVFIEYIYVEENNTFEEVGRILAKINLSDYYTKKEIDGKLTIYMSNGIDKQVHLDATAPYIDIVNGDKKILLNIDENASYEDDYPPIRMYLNSDGFESVITPYGFCNKTDDGYKLNASGYEIGINRGDDDASYLSESKLSFHTTNGTELQMNLGLDFESGAYGMTIGSDEKFKISRSTDNTEGATITGVKSITAFANPSATEVWATDGSTADLSTKANVSDLDAKANASDVLLKKSASGGYYIEKNSNELGKRAFATNDTCAASGWFSHAEGSSTIASNDRAHAEGGFTTASGASSHAEGAFTTASAYASHAEGCHNVVNNNAIHSIGIGNGEINKNSEYVYVKNNRSNTLLVDDPKNGYKYLIGVGGYDGISTDNTTYKSVQEVIADLTARIEQLETKVKALEAANAPA